MSSMDFDILVRRKKAFVLWTPSGSQESPSLVLGTIDSSQDPAIFNQIIDQPLQPAAAPNSPYLWELPLARLGLQDGVYHYWFRITDTSASKMGQMLVTDPFASAVDYRRVQNPDNQPASVIKVKLAELVICDPDGDEPVKLPVGEQPAESLGANDQIVIYELPISFTLANKSDFDRGTFRDAIALLVKEERGDRFSNNAVVSQEAIIAELGINALEVLPPTDSKVLFEWGYAPANYCSPDYDLGGSKHRASSDFAELAKVCLQKGIRLINDIVMAFGYDPYVRIDYQAFHIIPKNEPNNPDSYQSNTNPRQFRDGYGGESWRYDTPPETGNPTETYDPQSGQIRSIYPARAFHKVHLAHWMSMFHLGGLRLDSINNVANWDFIAEFRAHALQYFADLYPPPKNSDEARKSRFIVIGEELSLPLQMIKRNPPCVDALWNQPFEFRVKAAIVGEGYQDNFEDTVRKMIDCRQVQLNGGSFTDCTQAVNYIASHDTEGNRNERLCNFLDNMNIADKEQRSKLAFVCLLTAVGIPMILAGDEFCVRSNKANVFPYKEEDPINWSSKNDPWRLRLFNCVKRLIVLRKFSRALGVNDVSFIHTDFSNGRRILAWVRGNTPDKLVVVVANFSDVQPPGSEYDINGWPGTPAGMKWRNVMLDGTPTVGNAGRERLVPWDSKVYELFRPGKDD